MSDLTQISINLHLKNKEIKEHVKNNYFPKRETFKKAEAQFEIDMAKERLKAKATNKKITEANAKNTAIEILEQQRLDLVVAESDFEKENKGYYILLGEYNTLEIEANNVRAEVKRFGG